MRGRRRHTGATALVAVSVVLAVGCTGGDDPGPPVGLITETPTTSAPIQVNPEARASLYLVTDETLYGVDPTRFPSPPASAIDSSSVGLHLDFPFQTAGIARGANGAVVAISQGDRTALIDSAGRVARTVTVSAKEIGDPSAARIELLEAEGAAGRVYVAGRYARPGQADFGSFVLTFGPRLEVQAVRLLPHVVQSVAADERGAVALLSDGEVIEVASGRVLLRPTYRMAAEATSVRRDSAGGLWVGVGQNDRAYLLTPSGKEAALPTRALPYNIVALPSGAVAVVCSGTSEVIITTAAHEVRRVKVPRSAQRAVLANGSLHVLSAGEWSLSTIALDTFNVVVRPLAEGTALIA